MSSADEFRRRTLARLEAVKNHLPSSPRADRLKDKVCIITGAGSLKGIGRASAILFAHQGARHLYLSDYDATNLPELKATIERSYPDVKVTTQQADAADEDTVRGLCDRAMKEEGRLDAGWASSAFLTDIDSKLFMESMRINALSCLLAVKYASAAMQKTNPSRGKEHSAGSIILTASVAGIRSGAGTTDYSASKAAVNSIVMTACNQLARLDIRVNSICPGLIETGMTATVFDAARARGTERKIGQLNPLGRYGVPIEIANVAMFLASDEASYVNGQMWAVDGGLSSSHPVVPGKLA
ncbi:NAD-P-binding protein [Epithele typhae]|uniref:NAD-P-binding protein n=1 Tax=Epithele typhae TaxID=378194 RepID=UPI002007E7F6|nr:NAD-P-binding protein [Epithele typhae]KAH9942252.1 NAD-P-binding protein [Epithele typhae]